MGSLRRGNPVAPFLRSWPLPRLLADLAAAIWGIAGWTTAFAAPQQPLACNEVSFLTQRAISALVEYAMRWPAGAYVDPTLPSVPQKSISQEQAAATDAMLRLITEPDFGPETLCSVLPVDRAWLDPDARKEGEKGPERKAETLLTAAIKTGEQRFVTAALKVESSAKGSVYATNGDGARPMTVAKPFTFDPGTMAALNPGHIPWPPNPPGTWARLQTEGTSGPIVPDVDDAPDRLPAYVTALVSSQQGVSIGASNQAGSTSPKIQGEIRYTLFREDKPDRSDEYAARFFLFANGNVNSNKDDTKPTNPSWAGVGLGFKELLSTDIFGFSNDLRWIEPRLKVGDVENLLPMHRANYLVSNLTVSAFFPFSRDFGGGPATLTELTGRAGDTVYGSATIGGQIQKHLSGVVDVNQRSTYTFERLDIYAYPLWLVSEVVGAGPGCFNASTSSLLKGECSIVSLHLDRQIVNNGQGTLNELSLSWGFRKGLSMVVTRSIGVQDPISNFGLKLPRSAQTQLSLKITPNM